MPQPYASCSLLMMACPCIHSDEPYGEPIKPKGWDCGKGCFLEALVECPYCHEKHAYHARSPYLSPDVLITTCAPLEPYVMLVDPNIYVLDYQMRERLADE